MVERSAVNRLVVGSNPTCGAKYTRTRYQLCKVAGFYVPHRVFVDVVFLMCFRSHAFLISARG